MSDRRLEAVKPDVTKMVNLIFPFQVFEDWGMEAPEGGAVMTLEAGFREEEDAEIFVDIKNKSTGKKYIIKRVNKENVEIERKQ